jgi:hypothetical protein
MHLFGYQRNCQSITHTFIKRKSITHTAERILNIYIPKNEFATSHLIASGIVSCCIASSVVGGSSGYPSLSVDTPACPCPSPPQPDVRTAKKISPTRAKYERTPQKSQSHVQSHHNPNPYTPALPPVILSTARWIAAEGRNKIPVD